MQPCKRGTLKAWKIGSKDTCFRDLTEEWKSGRMEEWKRVDGIGQF